MTLFDFVIQWQQIAYGGVSDDDMRGAAIDWSSAACGIGLGFCVFFWFSLDYFVLVLFAFVVLGLVSSVPHKEIG